jgi:hypothetical protein
MEWSVRKVVHFVFQWPGRGAIPPVVSFWQVDAEQPLPNFQPCPTAFPYPLQWSSQPHIFTSSGVVENGNVEALEEPPSNLDHPNGSKFLLGWPGR